MSENQGIETPDTEDVEGHMPRHKVSDDIPSDETVEGHMPRRMVSEDIPNEETEDTEEQARKN